MQKLSLRKQLVVVRLYLGGLSYDEIAAKADVSKGTVANIISELKAGRFPEASNVSEQLELLRELAVDLRRYKLTPGRAAAGVAAFSHLQEFGLESTDIERWAALCHALTPESEAQAFARAALTLEEVRKRTGLSVDALDKKVHNLGQAAGDLEPLAQQADPDMNLHVVDVQDEGIVVRGAKIMICGIAATNEIFVLPGSGYRETDEDFAVSFVIPKDIEGLTIVETRHPSDMREFEEGFDIPVKIGGITQAYLLFQDVFVPKERVFMCKEFKYSGVAVTNFIMPYRAAIGSCVAGQGDIMVGAAALLARANGLSTRVFTERLTKMYMNNETTFALGVAAAALGRKHPSGYWLVDPLISNVNKVYVATLPYETKILAQDIGGGIAETGCMPSFKDLNNPKYGHLLRKYLKAASSAEARTRLARLIEWLTVGAGIPGCMHGGGSPEAAKLVLRVNAGLERSVALAARLAGVEEDIPEPARQK